MKASEKNGKKRDFHILAFIRVTSIKFLARLESPNKRSNHKNRKQKLNDRTGAEGGGFVSDVMEFC